MGKLLIDTAKFDKKILAEKKIAVPAIVGWNRLEPRPRSADFGRSLKAEVWDALWMISRQWQVGEFKGEDAGSPVNARLLTYENLINRYAVKNGKAAAFDKSVPLETTVEEETAEDSLKLKVQVSVQFFKLLAKAGPGKDYAALLKSKYPIGLPSGQEEKNRIQCSRESLQLFTQARIRSIDGYLLLNEIVSGDFDTWVNSQTDTDVPASDKNMLIKAGNDLAAWFKRMSGVPVNEETTAWSAPDLEYRFECSAPESAGKQTILTADEYDSGSLDWYSFDVDKSRAKLTDDVHISDPKQNTKLLSFIPSNITFGGMPNSRYWEMEDRKTDFGAIDADTTDVAKLVVSEFGLISGDDWFIFPYTMKTGNICKIGGLIVTDTFGDRTLIRAAGEGSDNNWQNWRVYNLSASNGSYDSRLLLLPTAAKVIESDPLEKVDLIRDEMANMVWGVEDIITMPSGFPRSGYEAAKELSAYLSSGYSAAETALDAAVKYTLGSSVPENWIPFISVHTGGSDRDTQMQRAYMPRTSDGTNSLIPNRTDILSGDNPFYIHEEEVPRSGTIVTKTYQRTRWYNGKVILWIGRRVTNGKGEGNSGLKFDQINKINS